MRECDVWKNNTDSEFENAMEGMEKLVMNRLYELLVPVCSNDFVPAHVYKALSRRNWRMQYLRDQ